MLEDMSRYVYTMLEDNLQYVWRQVWTMFEDMFTPVYIYVYTMLEHMFPPYLKICLYNVIGHMCNMFEDKF